MSDTSPVSMVAPASAKTNRSLNGSTMFMKSVSITLAPALPAVISARDSTGIISDVPLLGRIPDILNDASPRSFIFRMFSL